MRPTGASSPASISRTRSPTRWRTSTWRRVFAHGEATPEGSEALEVRWVPFAEVLAMTTDGRISDAMTVLAIQGVALGRSGGSPQ